MCKNAVSVLVKKLISFCGGERDSSRLVLGRSIANDHSLLV